jgi:hypothetical protein
MQRTKTMRAAPLALVAVTLFVACQSGGAATGGAGGKASGGAGGGMGGSATGGVAGTAGMTTMSGAAGMAAAPCAPLGPSATDISAGQGIYTGYTPSAVIDSVNSKLLVVTYNGANSGKPSLFRCAWTEPAARTPISPRARARPVARNRLPLSIL